MITSDELIKNLKEYDFKQNSLASFSRCHNNISTQTIKKYLKELNIEYQSRNQALIRKRDPKTGKFCLAVTIKINENDKNKSSSKQKEAKIFTNAKNTKLETCNREIKDMREENKAFFTNLRKSLKNA
jgi:hypothetical protein